MYGFQPKSARGKAVQQLADGGMVHSIKGMLGLRPKTREELLAADAKAQARNQEAAGRVAERAAQQPQPAPATPAPPAAISDYSGMNAMQRREKEQGLKNGGMVKPHGFKAGGLIRGPGTGTSDSIPDKMAPGTFIMPADSTEALGLDDEQGEGEKVPVRVSNGEFELPPERVQAVGAAVLQAIKGMTHTPTSQAGKVEPMARGFKPKGEPPPQFFFKGGEVKSPEELRKMIPQVEAMGYKQAPAVTPAPAAPAPAPAAPPAAPTTAPAPAQPSEYSRQMSAVGGALADGAAWLGKTIVSAPGYGFNRPSAAPAPAPAPTGATTTAGAGRGAINPTPVNPTQPATAAPAPTNAPTNAPAAPTQQPTNEVMPGVYRHGRGQYSDNASGMGLTSVPGSGGQGSPVGKTVEQAQREGLVGERVGYNPAYDQRLNGATGISAQNMAAADALVARQTPAGFQPAGVQAPIVRNSTNDWAARKALENMATAASSITNRPEWQSGSTTIAGSTRGPKGEGDPEGKVAAYKAALANDFALQQAQPGMDQTAMRENAAITREGMQQAGATTRTGMTEQGANAREAGRNALTAEELGLKREAQGFQTRAAAQREKLRNTLIDPKATPEQRKQAQEYLQALAVSGKEQPARYKVAAGGQQIDANGVAYKVPDRVFNEQTGEFADGRGAAAPAPIAAPKAGEVRNGYRFKGGNPNDQANWTKV